MAVKKAKKAKKRKPNKAFMKPLKLSEDLAAVVGSKSLPRTQIVKKLWVYIKRHKLQDAKNKRMVCADAKLKPVFGGKSKVSMFEIMKHLKKHVK
jgi:upstream activation factor subunit UAF30